MTFSSAWWRACWVMLGCLWLSGCLPPLGNDSDDERNPLITDARAKRAAYNYTGAIDSLKKALEANPRLALAHWELGLIYYQNVKDYAAAIYHFEELLRLKPDWKQADTVRQFITVCKTELAASVPLGPQTPQAKRDFDQLTARLAEVTRENAHLKELLLSWQNYAAKVTAENSQLRQQYRIAQATASEAAARLAAAPPANSAAGGGAGSNTTAQAEALAPPAVSTPVLSLRTNRPAARGKPGVSTPPGATPTLAASLHPAAATPPATYVVKPRETLFTIAREHHLKLADLEAANPGVDVRHLKVGQVLKLPAR